MTIKEYDLGDAVTVRAAFTNPTTQAALDPDAVFFKYKNPAGTIVTLQYGSDAALVKDSTGIYHVDVNANAAGKWLYRFYSTGTGQAAEEGAFKIRRSSF
jgi:hypothetical protein